MNGVKVENRPMTIKYLRQYLDYNVRIGKIKETDTLYLSSDEEGNSFSPMVIEGISKEGNKIVLYPLFKERFI